MRKKPLPVLNCDDCGLCCSEQGTPPGFAVLFPPPGVEPYPEVVESEDWNYFHSAPDEAKKIVSDYFTRRRAGEVEDREGLPCLWYDEQTKRCKYYEHRPETCRTAITPGDKDCRRYRRLAGKS